MDTVLQNFARQIKEMSWARVEEPGKLLSPLGGVVVRSEADIAEVSEKLQKELQAEIIPAPKTAAEAERRFTFTTAGGKSVILQLSSVPTSELISVLRQIADFNDIANASDTKRKSLHPESRVVVVFPVSVWESIPEYPFIDLFGSVCRLDLA